MLFVLDASIVGCWCFHDEQNLIADEAWELLESERARAVVPLHWKFEVCNVLLQGERKRRIREAETIAFLQGLERFAIDLSDNAVAADVLVFARKHHLTFYDAVYLALALREGIALATLDRDLASAALNEHVQLISPPG